jgi:predicted phosphodiesterase
LEKSKDYVVCNPGSPSLPKMQTQPGFAIYENKQITLYNIEGNKITSLDV